MIIILLMLPLKYFTVISGYKIIFRGIRNQVTGIFKEVRYPNYIGLVFMVVMMFMYLIMRNLIGLFPFVFTFRAHPCVTLGLGVVLWISFFFYRLGYRI